MRKKLIAKTQNGSWPPRSFLNYLSLKLRIKKNEGFSSEPYRDKLGNYTIGYGHLISKKEIILFKKKTKLSFFQDLFENDFKVALEDYNKHFSKYSFSQSTKELIIEMIFQMGTKNVLGFKKTLKHIKKNNNFLASLEMMNSIWYKQTPMRVENLIKHFLKI